MSDKIRNFSIIAHIDHGKSTLADRMLEVTGTVEKRKMKEQVLDSMDLERERGITIKMQPVRMDYKDHVLNLIDTPGHIDFSYEVSRALKAVEGSILLVDSTQGVQAQTLTTLNMARDLGLKIIPVLSKVDSPLARIDEVKLELSQLIDCDIDDIIETSGKTGSGVEDLLDEIIRKIPSPKKKETDEFRSLVFDFHYDNHKGVIVFVRVMSGSVKRGDKLMFKIANENFNANEVGVFMPEEKPVDELSPGSIGYIVTGIKEPGIVSVGDTVARAGDKNDPLPGYMQPKPVVWASVYPESQDDFPFLKQALDRLKLSDSSLSYEEEASGALGRGFRCGFLGMLHLEIITERLRREFNLNLIVTTPSITYEVHLRNGKKETVYSPVHFPDNGVIDKVFEPVVSMEIIAPSEYIGPINQMLFDHEGEVLDAETFGDNRTKLVLKMPLREMMRGFFDKLKSVTSGYASVSYDVDEMREADVTRLDILVAEEIVPAFSRVIAKRLVEEEAEQAVEKLKEILPRQMFVAKIQAKADSRIIASRTLKALRKDVTAKLYGGDVTRKMKLREKQKKGKKRMASEGKVNIPHDVFMKMMRNE